MILYSSGVPKVLMIKEVITKLIEYSKTYALKIEENLIFLIDMYKRIINMICTNQSIV